MIRLSNLLVESTERRVNLMRVIAIMEKVLPELKAADAKKITEAFTEFAMLVENLNSLPYTVKEYKLNEWQLLSAVTQAKLTELREHVAKLCTESSPVDLKPLVKALEEVLVYN